MATFFAGPRGTQTGYAGRVTLQTISALDVNEANLTADATLSVDTAAALGKPVQMLTPDADGWKLIGVVGDPWGARWIFNLSATYSFDLYQPDGTTMIATVAANGSVQLTQKQSTKATTGVYVI